MAEQLTPITPGSKASSSVINDNFTYLQGLITQLSTKVSGLEDGLNQEKSDSKDYCDKKVSDVYGIATAAQTAANNASTKATNAAGGKWTFKQKEVVDGAKNGKSSPYTYSMKNYLPSSGDYEVYIHAYMRDDSSSQKYCRISTTSFGNNSGTGGTYSQLFVAGYADRCVNDFILPAKYTDELKYQLTGNVDYLEIRFFGYRKLGST